MNSDPPHPGMVRRIIVCRHGKRRSDGQLSSEGERQSRVLGENLRRWVLDSKLPVARIVTSTLARAMQTGEIVKQHSFPDTLIDVDSNFDEQYFGQNESYGALYVRIQRGLRRLIQREGVVVVVTHSGWIFSCFRLLGLLPPRSRFRPVGLASMHQLVIPVIGDHPKASGWFCEPSAAYAAALKDDIPMKVSMVPSKWSDRPTRTFGASVVVAKTADWIVMTDVWKMEKYRYNHVSNDGVEVLMAISMHNRSEGGEPLACLRDLRQEHLGSLLEIDSLYPDEEWVKYILYPPWVYQLHIHIQRKGSGIGALPCRNMYYLSDVISLVRDNVTRDGCLLVYYF